MTPLALDTSNLIVPYGAPAHIKPMQGGADKARKQAENFETQFISSMMQHMFTAIGKEGPFGNGQGVGVWRSMLTEQYAKSFVKAGGIGIANQVYKSLVARQTASQSSHLAATSA
jgi:peptidoglycan hydrolase FlgJ